MTEQHEPTGPVVEDKRSLADTGLAPAIGTAVEEYDALATTDPPPVGDPTVTLLTALLAEQRHTNKRLHEVFWACGGPQAMQTNQMNYQAVAAAIEAANQPPVIAPAFGQPGYKDPGRKGN